MHTCDWNPSGSNKYQIVNNIKQKIEKKLSILNNDKKERITLLLYVPWIKGVSILALKINVR